jgi:hypothetical protein
MSARFAVLAHFVVYTSHRQYHAISNMRPRLGSNSDEVEYRSSEIVRNDVIPSWKDSNSDRLSRRHSSRNPSPSVLFARFGRGPTRLRYPFTPWRTPKTLGDRYPIAERSDITTGRMDPGGKPRVNWARSTTIEISSGWLGVARQGGKVTREQMEGVSVESHPIGQ